MGYLLIILLMALESSFFPFPSEVVIPPAGFLCAQGKMNLFLVILSGIVGSVLGALFNYYISYRWGRKMVLNLGEKFGLTVARLSWVEAFFERHGEITTFIGRLLPGIRQYISLPAGLGKMDLGRFILFTALGSGIWVTILALLGYFVGDNLELIRQLLKRYYPLLVAGLLALVALYTTLHHPKRPK